ncbi:MAG TPA: T9SS type A sorting domain-containing protein [candidate division Zixibacteria bacterium]|nr:T9SS type A sorting domain-containing protein [candidate division Zixibacteria bacterium]
MVNYPNPFKNYTEFVYTLTHPVKSVKIKVFTLRGRLIKEFDGPTDAGYHSVGWDGIDADGDPIANGSYIYKIIVKDNDGKKYTVQSVAVRMR